MPSRPAPRPFLLLPLAFLLVSLPLLLLNVQLVPTGEVPDELAHLLRMDGLFHGSLVGQRSTRTDGAGNTVADSGVLANAGLIAVCETFAPGTPVAERVVTQPILDGLRNRLWERQREFVRAPNTAVYAPTFYVPGAFALAAARWTGNGPWHAVFFVRAVNAACYAVLGLAALLLARRGQGFIFAALTLPMSLALGASCSQDGLLIATAACAAALLSRGSAASWWTGTAMLAAVAMAKLLYLPLAGFVFLSAPAAASGAAAGPGRHFLDHGLLSRGLLGRRLLGAAAVALPALAWYFVASRYATVPFVRGAAYAAGPYWPGPPGQLFTVVDAAKQLRTLLHDPVLIFRLPFEALGKDEGLREGMIGILGQLDVRLPQWVYQAWTVALIALCLADALARSDEPGPGPVAALGCLLVLPATVMALYLGQYLSWTHIGWTEIEGMQGRYFIPLLPFAGLALPRLRVAGAAPLRLLLRLPALGVAVAGLAVIPAALVATYYTGH